MSAVLKLLTTEAILQMRESAVRTLPPPSSEIEWVANRSLPEKAISAVPPAQPFTPTQAIPTVRASAIPSVPASVPQIEREATNNLPEKAKAPVPPAQPLKPDRAKERMRESASRRMPDLAPIIDSIRESHRQRQDFHRAEKSLTLQVRAVCRRLCDGDIDDADVLYDAMFGKGKHPHAELADALTEPFIQARNILQSNRKQVEKRMDGLAKKLPIYPWVESIKGFGVGSLAAVIGETGDLSNYSTHSKLWKRLGLAVMADGRQRRVSGAAALEHGYSPSRRSIVWNVGQCVFKSQSQRIDKKTKEVIIEAGFYRKLYDARKEYESPRVETKGHAHNRATRYLEKRLIRDLWKEWRNIDKRIETDSSRQT